MVLNEALMRPYTEDYRKLFNAPALAVCFIEETPQLQKLIHLCRKFNVAIIPQGGNTSYCGGANPTNDGPQVIVNLKRMNQIIRLDEINRSLCVEAGATLEQVQQFLHGQGLIFPLDLGSRSNAQIGGLISTNAGGINVVKFGNMRDLVLGIEFIDADGNIINELYRLRKNNTGYNLCQLLTGAEGTLGIITKAELKLVTRPQSELTALLAFNEFTDLITAFAYLKSCAEEWLYSFEYISKHSVQLTKDAAVCSPINIAEDSNHFALIQLASSYERLMENIGLQLVSNASESANACEAIIAQSQRQSDLFWTFRESIPHAERHFGGSIKFDIAVPISELDYFISEACTLVTTITPHHQLSIYGHVGDGNVHFNVLPPSGLSLKEFSQKYLVKLEEGMDTLIRHCRGSFSAEHGIGQLKRHQLNAFKQDDSLKILENIKKAIDKDGLLNPDKLLP